MLCTRPQDFGSTVHFIIVEWLKCQSFTLIIGNMASHPKVFSAPDKWNNQSIHHNTWFKFNQSAMMYHQWPITGSITCTYTKAGCLLWHILLRGVDFYIISLLPTWTNLSIKLVLDILNLRWNCFKTWLDSFAMSCNATTLQRAGAHWQYLPVPPRLSSEEVLWCMPHQNTL